MNKNIKITLIASTSDAYAEWPSRWLVEFAANSHISWFLVRDVIFTSELRQNTRSVAHVQKYSIVSMIP